MRAVGIKTLNSRLSEFLRIASQGETVLVTDREKVVAEISPPQPHRGDVVADAMLAEAVRAGWVRAPLVSLKGKSPSPPGVDSLASILSELDADRGDR